jgi:hypothetical protein
MATWKNSEDFEYITSEGETKIIKKDDIKNEDRYIIGLAVYTGEEILSARPIT